MELAGRSGPGAAAEKYITAANSPPEDRSARTCFAARAGSAAARCHQALAPHQCGRRALMGGLVIHQPYFSAVSCRQFSWSRRLLAAQVMLAVGGFITPMARSAVPQTSVLTVHREYVS